jgi:prepilin-type N-terminal cleavage/methylation domain-containing protein
MLRENERGFSLIELMISVAINCSVAVFRLN